MSEQMQVPELSDGGYWYATEINAASLAAPQTHFPQGAGGSWTAVIQGVTYRITRVITLEAYIPAWGVSQAEIMEALPVGQRPFNRVGGV